MSLLRESGVSTVLEWRHCGKANSLKGDLKKEQLKITIVNLPSRYCVHALPCCLAWRAVVLQASSSSSDWQRRRDHRRLSLLIIFVHFRVTRIGIPSGTVQHAILRASFGILANTTYKLYTFFKYYGREKVRV